MRPREAAARVKVSNRMLTKFIVAHSGEAVRTHPQAGLMQGKRTAGGADLPDTARVAVADVKRLFAAQKGFLDNFFQKVSLEGSVFRVCWVGVWVGDWTDA